eukprot:PITA_33212
MSRVPYASAVGSLMYALVCTARVCGCRWGIEQVSVITGYDLCFAVKLVFRYLRGTGLWFVLLMATGLLSVGYPWFCWSDCCTINYRGRIHGSHSCKQGSSLVVEIVFKYGVSTGSYKIDCDSQSAIFLAKNPAYHSKTKHIDVQYHFVRDMIEDKKVWLVKVDTLKNTADALTKSVSSEKFSWCRETMGISGLEK